MKQKIYNYVKTKVVTKNFIIDFLESVRNFLGKNLSCYEDKIDMTCDDMLSSMKNEGSILWFRFSINQLRDGGIMITLYGDIKC